MIARRRTLDQWRAVVFAATMPDSVRVYLLKLADHMDARRIVSVPRSQLARELGRHEQRIAERNKAAVEAGFLVIVSPGYRGHTAVYQGMFPDTAEVGKRTDSQYPIGGGKGTSERYPNDAGKRTENRYTTSKQPPESSLLRRVPNEGMEEGPHPLSAEVHRRAVPGWDREESA